MARPCREEWRAWRRVWSGHELLIVLYIHQAIESEKSRVVAAPKLSVFLLCSQGNCVCPVRVRVSSDRRRRGVAGVGPSAVAEEPGQRGGEVVGVEELEDEAAAVHAELQGGVATGFCLPR